jgi:hypothetical protein
MNEALVRQALTVLEDLEGKPGRVRTWRVQLLQGAALNEALKILFRCAFDWRIGLPALLPCKDIVPMEAAV